MKAIVLVNGSAGTANSSSQELSDVITPILRSHGIDAEILSVPPTQLQKEADNAARQGIKLVIACGGDGTISSVASALVNTDVALGILPQGTLNHFAKDIELPLDLAESAAVIGQGHVEIFDVGEVNGRVFINNSSLGMYSQLAIERDALRTHWNIGKWMAMVIAVLAVFKRFPMVSVRLEADENTRTRKSPVVFVGNNEYQFDSMRIGSRESLNEGTLSLYIANTQSRFGMMRLSVLALLGKLLQAEDLEASKHLELWVTSRRRTLLVATDGEVTPMQPPLHYRILPRSLRVCTPATKPPKQSV